MNIREASYLTGISKDMLRYYEKIGILSPGRNPDNQYRDYTLKDINDAVMIRQYSSLGLSLKSLAGLSKTGGAEAVQHQLQKTMNQLETELEWMRAKLENARDFSFLFSMLARNTACDTGFRPETYYYRRPEKDFMFEGMNAGLNGAFRMVFRIPSEAVELETYPTDQGFLAMQKIKGSRLPFERIPAHHYWRTIIEEEQDGVMNREKLRPVLQCMSKDGYLLRGPVFLYQIMSGTPERPVKLVCVECDTGEVN